MIAYTNPSRPDREDEFNKWYDTIHIPQILALPGFVRATRFQVAEQQIVPGERTRRYVAVYEIESDDPQATAASLIAAVTDGRVELSESLEMDPLPEMTVFESLRESS